jgi:ubiquinone biosynthesis protein UbiJ
MAEREEIEQLILHIRERVEELERSIPAHSTKPHHIMQIEELEDQVEALAKRLEELQ